MCSQNLYLQAEASPHGGVTKAWLFRFMRHGRPRWHGLGSVALVPLAEARDAALACRKMLREGVDPIEAKRAKELEAKLERASVMTFEDCAERYIAAHRPGWRNDKHAGQWEATLATYAYPDLRPAAGGGGRYRARHEGAGADLAGQAGDREQDARPDRVGSRLGDGAAVPSRRQSGAGGAAICDKLLPARAKVRAVEHHAALPYADLPGFMAELRDQHGTAARCLEFVDSDRRRARARRSARTGRSSISGRRRGPCRPLA